jgi:hypothetical protein
MLGLFRCSWGTRVGVGGWGCRAASPHAACCPCRDTYTSYVGLVTVCNSRRPHCIMQLEAAPRSCARRVLGGGDGM